MNHRGIERPRKSGFFGVAFGLSALVLALAGAAPARAQEVEPPVRYGAQRYASRLQEVYWNGYFEFQYTNPSRGPSRLDFRRFVLQAGYNYTDRIDFYSELELEHAVVEGEEDKGEVELEQAYLDFSLADWVTLRAGQILVPVGILNERHEPTSFFGVERNRVETALIPTTWFDGGVGVHGSLPADLSYRAYVMPALDAGRFNAAGLAEGRQSGSRSNAGTFATTGRIEWAGVRGLTLGASAWRGDTGSAFVHPNALEVDTLLWDADFRYRSGPLELRGLFAQVHNPDAAELNRLVSLLDGTNPNVAERMRGWYLEAGLHVLPRASAKGDLVVWTRYEDVDTQYRMPRGFTRLGVHDTRHLVCGVSYFPHPNVAWVVEVRRTESHNRDRFTPEPPDMLNVGLGWWF